MFESPSQMTGSVWLALSIVREWTGGPPGCSGLVGRPSRMFEVVGGPYRYPEVVERPSRMSESGRETLPDVPQW